MHSLPGSNCCNYGDRVPAIWFYSDSTRLRIDDGHSTAGNDECPIQEELPLNEATTVRIDVLATAVNVYYNGTKVCTEARVGRHEWHNVQVSTRHSRMRLYVRRAVHKHYMYVSVGMGTRSVALVG
jgi:hypothetical protein